jgi:phage terminase large subunit
VNATLQQFVERYGPKAGENGPVLLAVEIFGATLEPGHPNTLDPWQQRTLRAYGRGERGISIKACHGPGKTWVVSVMVWHQLLCRFPQHVVATAPSKGQLEGALVKEVRQRYTQLPEPLRQLFEVKALRVELRAAPDHSWFEARTARAENPEALQGVHCAGGFVLLIADEASAVHEKIFESASGSMSQDNATTVLMSNPTRTSGFFFDTHHKLADMWYRETVSHADSSRVSDQFVYDMERRYGRESSAFRVRCLGEFPHADQDTIIPFEFTESARKRDIVVHPSLSQIWGVDVARFGDDENVFLRRTSLAVLPEIEHWGGVDLMVTTGKVMRRWKELTEEQKQRTEVLVDVVGMGSGVVDRLQEQGVNVRGINVAESSAFADQYKNLGTELAWKAREWLSTRDHAMPSCPGGCAKDCPHEVLAQELGLWRYTVTSAGKLLREPKGDVKKRYGKSPDFADAFFLTFASEAAAITHGSGDGSWGGGYGWNQSISRNLAVV